MKTTAPATFGVEFAMRLNVLCLSNPRGDFYEHWRFAKLRLGFRKFNLGIGCLK